jgi:hypothetical protein
MTKQLLIFCAIIGCHAMACQQQHSRIRQQRFAATTASTFDTKDSTVRKLIDSLNFALDNQSDTIFTYLFNNYGSKSLVVWWRKENANHTVVYRATYTPMQDHYEEGFALTKTEKDSIDKYVSLQELLSIRTAGPLNPPGRDGSYDFDHYFIFNLKDSIVAYKIIEKEIVTNLNHPMAKLPWELFGYAVNIH